MKILVTGSKGQLGAELLIQAPKDYEVFGFDTDMDVRDIKAIDSVFREIQPDAVVHCAAYTNVDECEDASREMAMAINAYGTENMAIMAKIHGACLVYISTDYVFDGKKDTPYTEYDKPNPISHYGLSKYYGELAVKELLSDYYILRTTGLYSPHAKNFVETVIYHAERDASLRVVDDQVCTPTYSLDMAECVYKVLGSGFFGTYHATNSGQCSWHAFASEIFRVLKRDITVIPIKTSDTGRKARRPRYSVLENYKLEKRNIMNMRPWKEALRDFLIQNFT